MSEAAGTGNETAEVEAEAAGHGVVRAICCCIFVTYEY